jgi:hypothetical protein
VNICQKVEGLVKTALQGDSPARPIGDPRRERRRRILTVSTFHGAFQIRCAAADAKLHYTVSEKKEGTLVHYFRQQGMFQKVTTERDPKSARAELRYSVEHRLKDASFVRVSLVTGLQNQIRVQLSAIGHPVIGDRKYNPAEKLERRITRVALQRPRYLTARNQSRHLAGLQGSPEESQQEIG